MSEDLKAKLAGKMLARGPVPRPLAAKPSPPLRGRIMPTAVDSKSERKDKPDIIPSAQADVLSGVVAATVSTNRVMPLAALPDTWDVLACHHAIIGSGFTGFRLPSVGARLGDYAAGLMDAEFDVPSMTLDPPKQNIMDVRDNRSFAIQALARCNQDGLTALLAASSSAVTVHPLRWAGPWSAEEQYLMTVALNDHSILTGGATVNYMHTPAEENVSVTVPDVETVVGGGYTALVDLTFLSIDGEKWEAYPTRIQ